MKQPSPIEEIIDNVKLHAPKVVMNMDGMDDLRESIRNLSTMTLSRDDMMLIINTLCFLQRKIETLTEDNLQLMKQIEESGRKKA